MNRLKNRVAFVTGGCRGIGKGIALALAGSGARIVLTFNVSEVQAKEVEQDIRTRGGEAISLQMSVEDRLSVHKSLEKVNDVFGAVDILVNNAAIAQEKPFDTITDEDWNRMMAVNLQGPFICCQEVLPGMVRKGWGRIINITSIGGQWGGYNQVHYAVAKAGLINLTKSLAKIYSSRGITTNAISPGLVETDMAGAELKTAAGKEKIKNIPMGRIGTVNEISSTVVFLAGAGSSYITGQTISVNGGMYFG